MSKRKTDTDRQREQTNFWINLGIIVGIVGTILCLTGITLYNQATKSRTEIIK